MLGYAAPILVFGLVIFIHEFGHFVAAKLMGVYAPRFSIGFGPALFRRRRGETEYVLAALPLGGYVRMASRLDADQAHLEGGSEDGSQLKPGDPGYDPEAMIPFGPKAIPENRWFESKGLVARLFIMVAGVVMNVVLAWAVYAFINVRYGETVDSRVIARVHAVPSAPTLSQLQQGDTVLQVNGTTVRNWGQIIDILTSTGADTIAITTNRNRVEVPVGGTGQLTATDLLAAIDPQLPPVIGEVVSGTPAAKAGLQAGDSIASIGGTPIREWSDLLDRVSASPGVEQHFEIVRAGKVLPFTIRPESTTVKDPLTKESRLVGRIGAVMPNPPTTREPMSLGRSLSVAVEQTWSTGGTIVETVRKLFTREVALNQLGGPIAITRASVAAAKSGMEVLLKLIALLSVNVAVLNLLPIPILDGGQILLNIAEAAKGAPFSMRTREYILRVGLVLILMIFVLSTFNDLKALLSHFFARA